MKELENRDAYEPRLKSIVLDRELSWKIGFVNEDQEWRALGLDSKAVNNGIVYVKSLVWPGQYTSWGRQPRFIWIQIQSAVLPV